MRKKKLFNASSDIVRPSTLKQFTADEMKKFSQWCQQFHVSMMTGKTSEIEVRVGDKVKYVNLERF